MKYLSGSANNLRLAKFNTEKLATHMEYNIKKMGIIPDKNNDFFLSTHFKKQVKAELDMWKHPLLYKKITETNTTVTLKVMNITHSQKYIKINNDKIETIKVGSYWKNGKEVSQYAPASSWEIELTKDAYNEMLRDVTNDTEAIKNIGGKSHTEKIIMKLENDLNTNPSYDYINYLKYKTIIGYSNYEKDLEDINKPKPDEE